MYLLGLDGYRRAEDKEKYIEKTALAICAGFGFELVLMYFYNVNKEQLSIRSMYSIWTGETLSVTLLGLLVSVVIGFAFYSFFYTKKKGQKILVFFMLVVGLVIAADTATRTPFVLFFVVFAIMLVVHLFNRRGIRALRLVLFGIILLVIFWIFYGLDIWGVKTAIWNTPLAQRFLAEEFESGRMDLVVQHFSLMLDYPWGGGHIQNVVGKMAHNYLQQGYDLYGAFAFFFLLLITAQFLSNMWRMLVKRHKSGVEMLFLSMYLAMLTQMCLEPIYTGYPILFWCVLMIHGMATAYLKEERKASLIRNGG